MTEIISDNTKIFFDQKNVNVHGGFKCPNKGHFVEITNGDGGFLRNGEITKRISVPFWSLSFPDENLADMIFQNCFGYPINQGLISDKRKGLKPKIQIKTF